MSAPKPHRVLVKPKSERQVLRLAALLAYQALPWPRQQDLRTKARELLTLMAETRAP